MNTMSPKKILKSIYNVLNLKLNKNTVKKFENLFNEDYIDIPDKDFLGPF